MAISLNNEDMDHALSDMIQDNETILAKTWGTINYTPKLNTYRIDDSKSSIGFQNIYAYIALSNTHIKIITLHSLDTTRKTGEFNIPLQDITETEVQKGLLKSSLTLHFDQEKIKILWLNSSRGSEFNHQEENVKKFCSFFNKKHID